MKFPLSILDRDWYYSEINKLLKDKNCSLIIDTNILGTLFKLHDSARAEFFQWIDPLINDERVKTPVWALNEYTKRFINKQTNDYLSTGNKLNTINKEFAEIKKFLVMHVDPATLTGIGYADEKEYNDDLDTITKKLQKLLSGTKAKKADYIIKVHQELESKFSKTVLKSDIFELLDKISINGPNRYKTQLPPGFKDGDKEFNSFGDLIIWKEIINYAKAESVKKVIILTNDNKPDWLYAPLTIKTKGRTIGNSNPELKIADTRLVFEFNLATDSDELYIINFELLTQVLIDNGHENLYQLAKSLQLVKEEGSKNISKEEADTESQADVIKDIAQISETEPVLDEEVTDTVASITKSAKVYDELALTDIGYVNFHHSKIKEIVEKLRSHDWYIQNPAIEELKEFLSFPIAAPGYNKNDLFVLGRNIYQSACGGAYAAIQFLQDFVSDQINTASHLRANVAAGMFYEIFFDARGQFRKGEFKSSFVDLVFELQRKHDYHSAISFIRDELNPYTDFLLVLPSSLPVSTLFNIILTETNTEWGIMKNVSSIKVNDDELLQDGNGVIYSRLPSFANLKDLVEEIKRVFAIPTSQIILQFNQHVSETDLLLFGSNKVFWRGTQPTKAVEPEM